MMMKQLLPPLLHLDSKRLAKHEQTMPEDRPIPPTLVTLPPELVLRILALLDPQSTVRLSSTCQTLCTIGRTESLWRELVLDLERRFGDGEEAAPPRPSSSKDDRRTWWNAASFLLPLSNRLGYFCSSKKFTCVPLSYLLAPSSDPFLPQLPHRPRLNPLLPRLRFISRLSTSLLHPPRVSSPPSQPLRLAAPSPPRLLPPFWRFRRQLSLVLHYLKPHQPVPPLRRTERRRP
jgi:hypothetical protein